MGNVQCCANGRFREGKPKKEPKNKKIKKKQTKDYKKKNGVSGGGKGDSGVKKVVTVAEDGSERAAPAETLAQATSPAADTLSATPPQQDSTAQNDTLNGTETDSPRGESMTTARERFFGQVFRNYSCKSLHFKN